LPKPLVIGIAGCSGSGKTTLARELAMQLDATLFPLDFYYRDLTQLPLDSRHKRNFDHPESFASELIVQHVRMLANGEPIERPVYDFRTHSRVAGKFDRIEPKAVVMVEGILALHYAELVGCYGLAIFVSAPEDLCLARRIHRDMRERGRTEESIREQFHAAVRPMAELYVLPSASHATITVDGAETMDRSVERVLDRLRTQGFLSGLNATTSKI
jgi:uridine kinase